ncbi:MAG: tetratricopeptide repeat-containing sulfotransferase family protein [Isosphaeraceae bacterium]
MEGARPISKGLIRARTTRKAQGSVAAGRRARKKASRGALRTSAMVSVSFLPDVSCSLPEGPDLLEPESPTVTAEAGSNDPATLTMRARERLALGEHQLAAASARAALELLPDNLAARCILGLALRALGQNEEAVAELRRYLDEQPDAAAIHGQAAEALGCLGRLDEAAAHFRRAVELEPAVDTWCTRLGQVLMDLGRPEEALPQFEAAIRQRPDLAALRDSLGEALRALRRLDQAEAAYLDAIRLSPGLSIAHLHLGLLYVAEDRDEDALQLLKRAVELEPDQPAYWEILAAFYQRLERSPEAIVCWRRVLELGPADPAHAHLALAWVLMEESRVVEAEPHYVAAQALAPDSPDVQLDLGLYHQDRGEPDLAEAAFRKSIELAADHAPAHARLASLLGAKLPDADLQRARELVDDPRTSQNHQASLLFALARVCDGRGEYAAAAAHSRQANALKLAVAPRFRHFDPDRHHRFIDSLIGAFGRELFDRIAGAGLPTRQLVFIVGLPRSGTTLLEQVLASHPQVFGAGELPLARRTYELLPTMLGVDAPPAGCVAHLQPLTTHSLAQAYLERVRGLAGERQSAERIVDKMPDNTYHLGLLTALFPRATIIHCRRDLRDIALSCWMADFRSVLWAHDPVHIATRFQAHHRIMEHWRATLPAEIHEVVYEELVDDLEGVSRRVLAAAGLDWHPDCLEFHRTSRTVRSSSSNQVRQPLYRSSVGRWKNYEHELADLFAALTSVEGVSRPIATGTDPEPRPSL